MKPIAGSVIALALAGSLAPFNLWAQQNEAELIKQTHMTKHDAKRIALARVKGGTIKCVELEKENGILIWSVDVVQSGKKDLTDVWVDATTGQNHSGCGRDATFREGRSSGREGKKMAFTL